MTSLHRSDVRGLAFAVLVAVVPACGGGGGGGTPPAGNPPGAFNLLSPADGATAVALTPTLTWEDASAESSYSIEIDTDDLFGAPLVYASTPLAADATSHPVPAATLAGGTQYFWRVRASNLDGTTTATNAAFSFTTVAALPDPSFNTAKAFDCTFNLTRCIDRIVPALDASGDVYVSGRFNTYHDVRQNGILRLNPDGSVDTGFAIGSGFNGAVLSMAAATDGSGKIYAVGTFTSYNGTPADRIVRLNPDGTIDAAFVSGTGFAGGTSTVNVVAVSADGSNDVFVGGNFTRYDSLVNNVKNLVRLDANGALDTLFAVGTGPDFSVLALVPLADGDVYVGGVFHNYQSTAQRGLVRLNSDASLDPGFAPAAFNNDVNALAVDGAGDVYVGGAFFNFDSTINRIVRLNSNGTRDAGFDVGSGCSAPVDSVALATDGTGDILVGGEFGNYKGLAGTARLARINTDGTLDATFLSGTGFTGALGGELTIRALAPLPGGDVVAGGYFTIYNGTAVDHLVRLNPDGTLDASTKLGSGFNYVVRALAAATDGSGDVFAGGEFGFYSGAAANRIARINADGTPDAGFTTGTGFNQLVMALATATDGSGDVYVGGAFLFYNLAAVRQAVRLNSDGTLDGDFAPLNTVVDGEVRCLLPAGDGSGDVFVGGDFTGRIVRLDASGGVVNAAAGTGFNGTVLGMVHAPDASGDLIVVGSFSGVNAYDTTTTNRIVRLNSDLTLDAASAGAGFNGAAWCVAVAGTHVYVGGTFTNYAGNGAVRIARLTGALAFDGSFDPGTGFMKTIGAATVTGLQVMPSGRLYAAGDFETYDGAPSSGIAAVNPDGSIDAAFALGSGFTRRGWAVAIGQDTHADVYVGGEFRSYQNRTVDFMAALDADGSLD